MAVRPWIPCSISIQTEDELRVLVELLCHTKGSRGFDLRISRLRDEALSKWHTRNEDMSGGGFGR